MGNVGLNTVRRNESVDDGLKIVRLEGWNCWRQIEDEGY